MNTMKLPSSAHYLLLLTSLLCLSNHAWCEEKKNELRGPIQSEGTTTLPAAQQPIAGFTAPGADAMMTPDMLLVNPSPGAHATPQPLKAFIGQYLKMSVVTADIQVDTLTGIKIIVVNETNRPLVIEGNIAKATVGGQTYTAVHVAQLQQAVLPTKMSAVDALLKKILPAALTIGVAPTVHDIKEMRRPVLGRYGPDEVRREVELSRFGKRILWPHQKTEGVVYFDTQDNLAKATVSAPATTLFDVQDTGLLTSSAP